MEGRLEAVLIGCKVNDSPMREKEEYARLLNAFTAYTHRQSPKEILNVEAHSGEGEEHTEGKVETSTSSS